MILYQKFPVRFVSFLKNARGGNFSFYFFFIFSAKNLIKSGNALIERVPLRNILPF
jgi:hypothetical protein